ncbi:MAG: hypothetical protein A3H42_01975 [Deltaproteobacteria bacterium RIFCSPLOWO2_02_FULL_46_8]|nr:MAG: hypothetical protein A3H42_01975 [Deltaproteobacteria bacterium RIFCSPLOWO2_02_FULL_46_8]
MYDGSYETFEKLERPDTVTAIIAKNGKILIQQQRQPDSPHSFLSLPGGRCNRGETPERAIAREALEETGYRPQTLQLWRQWFPSHKIVYGIYSFVMRGAVKEQKPTLDVGERIVCKWIPFEEFIALGSNDRFHETQIRIELLKMASNEKLKQEFYRLLFSDPFVALGNHKRKRR